VDVSPWKLDTLENRIYSSDVFLYISITRRREYVIACSRIQKEVL